MQQLLFTLKQALNKHDIESFVGCFHEAYHSDQPIHPDRTFSGRDQLRKNWEANFNEIPDFSAEMINYALNNDSIWTEWEWHGTRRDNTKLFMRGVMIMCLQDNKIKSARLYIEPVEMNGKGIDAAVDEVMHGRKTTD